MAAFLAAMLFLLSGAGDADGGLVRLGSVPGRLPALGFTRTGGLLAWHDQGAVRIARLLPR
jgi:hypothetical protein